MKLLYVTTARIPTEKANGIQIVKMCEAFQRQGMPVTLIVPTRRQSAAVSGMTNLWEYYQVEDTFAIRYIPTPDFLRFEGMLPGKIVTGLHHFQCLFFSCAALLLTARNRDAVYYTRSLRTLFVLCLTRRLHRKPIYFEAHALHGDPHRRHPVRRLLTKIMAWMLQRLDGLIVITHRLKELYAAFSIPGEKICVAPDSVDAKRSRSTIEKTEARKRLGIPLDKSIVCYTGHLFAWKGVYVLAESSRHLSDNVCVYIVGGTDSDIRNFKAFTAQQNLTTLKIVGHVPYADVPLFLAASDVVVLPNSASARISKEYTSPLKLFEYMGAQRPIVASDLPSIREVLRHHENALLVTPDDPKSLADGIHEILANAQLAHQLAKTASINVRAYSWDARAQNIMRFFQVNFNRANRKLFNK